MIEARSASPLEKKGNAWVPFKRDIERYALMNDFQDASHRHPPFGLEPFNKLDSQGLGVSVIDTRKARFAYILLDKTVLDPRYIITKAGWPSGAWRALDSHYSPSKTGAKIDVIVEFNGVKYSRGQDPDEVWMKVEVIQSRARTLSVDIAE